MVAGNDDSQTMPHAHMPAAYRALSHCFTVRSDDDDLGRLTDLALGALRVPGGTATGVAYALRASSTAPEGSPGAVDVWRDDLLLAQHQRHGDALGWLVWDVNRSAAEASGHHLLFHAAALEASGTGIVLPGASGSGKSTLAAALARAGHGYLTDELTAFDLDRGELLPYPKPITVKPGSFGVLADMDPHAGGAEWQVPVGGDSGRAVGHACAPGLLVFPRYDAGAPNAVAPLSDTEAFFALALNAVNMLAHGAAGTAALGAMVARCQCVALTFSDLAAACDLIGSLAEGGAPREACAHAV